MGGSLHYIQKNILRELMQSSELRYSELKPEDMAGNLFMYHLKPLIRDGMIVKNNVGHYELTAEGKLHLDHLNLKTMLPRRQARIVLFFAAQNEKGEWLLVRKSKHPLFNKIGHIHGNQLMGESLLEAAKNIFSDRSGFDAVITHRGDGYATYLESGEMTSNVMFHFFIATNMKGTLRSSHSSGVNIWMSQDEINTNPDVLPTVKDLLAQHNKTAEGERFFVELNYSI